MPWVHAATAADGDGLWLTLDEHRTGVVDFITDANELGDTLTAHSDIAKIPFTGSTATGRKVMSSASNTAREWGDLRIPDLDLAACHDRVGGW